MAHGYHCVCRPCSDKHQRPRARTVLTIDQVRGGGGCGLSIQSGGIRGPPGNSTASARSRKTAGTKLPLNTLKHLNRQRSGGQDFSVSQHGQSAVPAAVLIIEVQSAMSRSAVSFAAAVRPV